MSSIKDHILNLINYTGSHVCAIYYTYVISSKATKNTSPVANFTPQQVVRGRVELVPDEERVSGRRALTSVE